MAMTFRLFSLLACVFFISCGVRTDPLDDVGDWYKIDYRIYTDKNFTQSEIISIKSGINLWSMSTHGRIDWKVYTFDPQSPPTPGHPVDYERSVPTEERVVIVNKAKSVDEWIKKKDSEFGNKNTVLLGYFGGLPTDEHPKNIASIWLVSDRLSDDTTRTIVAAHEFGHSLDVWHASDDYSIMSPILSDVKCLSSEDLKMFCSRHACDPSQLDQSCVIE